MVQRLGSSFFLFSVLIGRGGAFPLLARALITIALVLKLGLAPLHGWLVHLSAELRWEELWVVSSLQKAIPLFLVLQTYRPRFWLLSFCRALISAARAVRQSQLKPLFVYSSLLGGAWFLASSNFNLRAGYLVVYSLRLLGIMQVLAFRVTGETLMPISYGFRNSRVLLLGASLMSLIGMPPFRLFYFKARILGLIWRYGQIWLLLSLLVASSVFVYAYLRLVLQSLLFSVESPFLKILKMGERGALVLISFLGLGPFLFYFV